MNAWMYVECVVYNRKIRSFNHELIKNKEVSPSKVGLLFRFYQVQDESFLDLIYRVLNRLFLFL